ncbi:MAG TPA: DUF2282 domain-containing protein [Stellaceae bacterium]|nr:DUF2282 domain-containing protein [Stellaceae bacterium]
MKHPYASGSILAASLAIAGLLAACAPTQTAAAPAVEKCYGVNAVAKNDCKAGAHDCAGQSKAERDPASFVALPTGLCTKISGGSLAPRS